MGRSNSSKVSSEQPDKPELSVLEQVKNFGFYIEEQKAALADARRLAEKLQADYNHIRVERDAIQQEAFASTDFYERDLKTKKETIKDLEYKLQQKENENATIRKQWHDELSTTAIAYKMEKAEFINHISKIEKELKTLQNFGDKKAQLEAELADAANENARLVEKHKTEFAELERKYIEQGNHMRKDYEKSLEEKHKKLREEVEDRVGQRVRDILAENERLGEEIRMHVELTTCLRKDIEYLESESAGVSREVDLLREAESLHVMRNSNQARVITQTNTKVVTLENSIGNVVRHYGSERRALEEEHQRTLTDFQNERQALHRLIQTKTKELRRVRQLAQQVLRERGEVETFLIDSLHAVLHELGDSPNRLKPLPQVKGLKKHCRGKRPPTSQPSTRSVHSCPVTAKPHSRKGKKLVRTLSSQGGQGACETQLDFLKQLEEVPAKLEPTVDIAELSWVDREKVLRYLFGKINSAHQLQSPIADVQSREKYQELFECDGDPAAAAADAGLFGSVSDVVV